MLYADDQVLLRKTMIELSEYVDDWRKVFESKGMRVSLGKTKLMAIGMEGKTFDGKVDPFGVCGTKVMSHSVLCTARGKWVNERCISRIRRLQFTWIKILFARSVDCVGIVKKFEWAG